MQYHRPETMEEALALLAQGVPLAGGTQLTPMRREISAVVDLQGLGLDQIRVGSARTEIGSALRLQQIVQSEDLPPALRETCRLEAARNMRSMATVGGLLITADARSPLLTALLALDLDVHLEPDAQSMPLLEFLGSKRGKLAGNLITSLSWRNPKALRYAQVARSPADFPIVGVAVARMEDAKGKGITRLAIGGWGACPIRVSAAETALDGKGDLDEAILAVEHAYAQAEDAWAGAAYRSEVAGVLARRLLVEVLS